MKERVLGAIAAGLIAAVMTSPPAKAITYGEPDCTDNSDASTCGNRNVVSIVGIARQDYGDGIYSYWLSVRCSGSLLYKSQDRILVLTAGHCVSRWAKGLQEGWLNSVGVSFDSDVTSGDPFQYVWGGRPLLNRLYGPSLGAFNIYHDYAVVEFPAQNGIPYTGLGFPVDLSGVNAVTLPAMNYALSLLNPANPPLFQNVGYGISEWLNAPGTGGNAGGLQLKYWYGLRNVSMATAVLNPMMKDQSMLIGSMNPALGYSGICNGDSGGPNFYVDSNGAKIQVGISSSGDRWCRGMAILSRLDIPQARDFLACAITANTSYEYENCGCTTVNAQGNCE